MKIHDMLNYWRGDLSMLNQYVFNDVNELIAHLMNKLDNPTPLKIQKSLYFLWAFYTATYGNIDYDVSENEFAQGTRYPKELFKAEFEAWRYGPGLNKVYAENKSGQFDDLKDTWVPTTANEKEIYSFIDDLLVQINGVNDFGLVERSHQDHAWKIAFKGEDHCKMDNKQIKQDYIGYVKQQAEF